MNIQVYLTDLIIVLGVQVLIGIGVYFGREGRCLSEKVVMFISAILITVVLCILAVVCVAGVIVLRQALIPVIG